MTVFMLIATFFAMPVCVWIGYRAGRISAFVEAAETAAQDAREIERLRQRVQSTLLRARPAAPAQHTTH